MTTTYACRGTDPATGKRCKAIATRHIVALYYRDGSRTQVTRLSAFIGCRPCADSWQQHQINTGSDRVFAQPITDYDKDATV